MPKVYSGDLTKMFDLSGKKAMIFGGAGGFGQSDGAGYNHHDRLAGGKTCHFRAEAGKVIPGTGHGHELNGAAGKTHRHGPKGIFTNPVDGGVQGGIDKIAFRIGVQYSRFVNIRFVRGDHDNR